MPITYKPTPVPFVNSGALWTVPHDGYDPWDYVSEHASSKSPTESWDMGSGLETDVVLKVKFADRLTILGDIVFHFLEYPYVQGSGIYVTNANVTPFSPKSDVDSPTGMGLVYDEALITLHFSSATSQQTPAGQSAPVVMTEKLTPNAQMRVLDEDLFQWGSGSDASDVKPNEAPGIIEHGFTYSQTQHFVPSLPVSMLTSMGTVNSQALISPTLGSAVVFAPETLKLSNVAASRSLTGSAGSAGAWNVTTTFDYKATGWNKFLNPRKTDANHPDKVNGEYEHLYVKADPTATPAIAETIYRPLPLRPLISGANPGWDNIAILQVA